MSFSLIVPLVAGALSAVAVNYFADTLPRTRRLSAPACARCGTAYRWNTYLVGRQCPVCGNDRGLRPWIVWGGMLALGIYTWLQPHRMGYVLGMLLLSYFAIVIVIDVEHRLIMHPTSLAGGLLALGIGIWLRGVLLTLLGGLAGLAIMSVLYYVGVLFSKLRARRLEAAGMPGDNEEALGGGDVILAGVLGLLLGWPLIWFGLLLGILLGGLIGLVLVIASFVRGRYGRQALMLFMPYGPAFIVSAFFILFLPNVIRGIVPN